jgi:Homeodomain
MQQLNKKRQRATPDQLIVLEEAFIVNPSPNAKMREMIADRIRMTERSVQIWFQNRRAKVKQMQRKEAGDDSGTGAFYGGSPGVMDQMKRNSLMRSNSVGGHGGQYGALPADIKFGLRMGMWNGPLTPAASPSSKAGTPHKLRFSP